MGLCSRSRGISHLGWEQVLDQVGRYGESWETMRVGWDFLGRYSCAVFFWSRALPRASAQPFLQLVLSACLSTFPSPCSRASTFHPGPGHL